MSIQAILGVLGAVLFALHPHMVAVIAAAMVFGACAIVTLLAVRFLLRLQSCPHPHAIGT